jgi:hypothetical protein
MLKLQYTENELFMERVTESLEALITQRVVLTIRAGQALHVQPSNASFLLPADTTGLVQLELALRMETSQYVAVTSVDADSVEVSLSGTWIAETADAEEGVFLTTASDRAEFFIHELWQITQTKVSYLA